MPVREIAAAVLPGSRRALLGFLLEQGGGGRFRLRRGGYRGARAAPDQRSAAGDQHERPDDRVGEPDSQRTKGQQHAQQQQSGPERHLYRTAAGGQSSSSCARTHGNNEPGERVEGEPDSAGGGGGHERQPDQRAIDSVAEGDARADPTEPAARRVAAKRSRARMGVGGHRLFTGHGRGRWRAGSPPWRRRPRGRRGRSSGRSDRLREPGSGRRGPGPPGPRRVHGYPV